MRGVILDKKFWWTIEQMTMASRPRWIELKNQTVSGELRSKLVFRALLYSIIRMWPILRLNAGGDGIRSESAWGHINNYRSQALC